jgi:hypothetical protein
MNIIKKEEKSGIHNGILYSLQKDGGNDIFMMLIFLTAYSSISEDSYVPSIVVLILNKGIVAAVVLYFNYWF